ncbi:hypothetical protein [Streptacidiphilus anmyonensis]|uniref:hypothetical protein n=1 Tax=Streptacidiphilus anmyonensis TaxID=405782 RepID=UPI00128DC1A4|nr:hypothetical protein [Streptacidiphilus anmyonensis]
MALVVLPFVVDASTFGVVSSDVIAVGTLLLLVVAVVALRRDSGEGAGSRRVAARGRGAMAAGRNITGNATGQGSKVTGQAVPMPEPAAADGEQLAVEARGDGAMAAGQDISGNATGSSGEAS